MVMVGTDQLGERLRRAREHARMSQTEAAQAVDLTSAALSQYEGGKRKVDALLLDVLARLYGVPVGFFFGEQHPVPDWEEALRRVAADLSPQGKHGVSLLVERVRALEELYGVTGAPLPGIPHPPFAPLPEKELANYEVEAYAEKVRAHFALGLAPVLDMRSFLEAQGYQIFTVPFGGTNKDVSGMFFRHLELGPIIVVNESKAYSRRPYTMAHELCHASYHYDRPAILCRVHDERPLEAFAERFASYFLVPRKALHERLRAFPGGKVSRVEEAVGLARYFGVSYTAMSARLLEERRLDAPLPPYWEAKPVKLAQALGYEPSRYEFGVRPLPPEQRLPRSFIQLAYRALREGTLSPRRVAEGLGISDLELEERLEALQLSQEEPEEAYA